jgi:hypothetical protein
MNENELAAMRAKVQELQKARELAEAREKQYFDQQMEVIKQSFHHQLAAYKQITPPVCWKLITHI